MVTLQIVGVDTYLGHEESVADAIAAIQTTHEAEAPTYCPNPRRGRSVTHLNWGPTGFPFRMKGPPRNADRFETDE